MRLRATVKIDKKEYTVKELTVREIIDLISNYESNDDKPNPSAAGAKALLGITPFVEKIIALSIEGAELKDLFELAPSELAMIYEEFKEINSYFFEAAQRLELGKQVEMIVKEILKDFSQYALSLSKQVMQESGIMDTPS